MTRETTEIEAACIRLQQRYGTLADRQHPAFAELFMPDAVITLPGSPPFAGLDAIMAGQAQWKQSGVVMRHVCTNFTVDVAGEDRAEGLCYLMVFRAEPGPGETAPFVSTPASIGEYHDVFVCQDGGWRFQSRTLRWIFRGAPAS